MSDLRTNLILSLTGNLPGQARRYARDVEMIGQRGARAISMMNRGLGAFGRGIDRLGNRYTAFLFGGGAIGTLRMVGNLEARFTRLGIQANRGAEEVDRLKRRIFEVSQAPDIRIDPGQLTAAIEEIVEKTGDLKFAEDNLRNLAAAIQATGAEGLSIGGIAAEFQKMGLTDPDEVLKALDILTVQGKAGAFTLQNLAALGPRVVTAYTAMGRTGLPAIREMGAALQVIRQGTGSSEMAATAFEALVRTLGDADKLKILEGGGIKIFEPGSTTQMRSLPVIMEEIIKKTRGSKVALSKVFDAEAIRAFNAAAAEFQRTGGVASLDQFYNVQADGTTVLVDSARAAKDFNSAMTYLYTSYRKFADSELAGPVARLADALNGLEPGALQRWMDIAKWIGIIGAGAIGARMIYRGGRGLMGMFGKTGPVGATGGGMGLPGVAGLPPGVVPVYIVNKGFGAPNRTFFGRAGAAAAGTTTGAAAAGGLGTAAATAAALAPAVAATAIAAASESVAKAISGSQVRGYSTKTLQEMLARNNVMGGGPGSYQSRLIQAELDRRDPSGANYRGVNDLIESTIRKLEETKMAGELKITIDHQNQLRIAHMSGENLDLDVDTGRTMGGQR